MISLIINNLKLRQVVKIRQFNFYFVKLPTWLKQDKISIKIVDYKNHQL